jgi:hypothetical protein
VDVINVKNWKFWLIVFAFLIIIFTLFYSNYLAKKIKKEELEQISIFGQSLKAKADLLTLANDSNLLSSLDLVSAIAASNTTIPIIETD